MTGVGEGRVLVGDKPETGNVWGGEAVVCESSLTYKHCDCLTNLPTRLLAFALYRAWRGESTTVPIGLTIYFVLLSILLPIIIPWDGLFWGCDRFD